MVSFAYRVEVGAALPSAHVFGQALKDESSRLEIVVDAGRLEALRVGGVPVPLDGSIARFSLRIERWQSIDREVTVSGNRVPGREILGEGSGVLVNVECAPQAGVDRAAAERIAAVLGLSGAPVESNVVTRVTLLDPGDREPMLSLRLDPGPAPAPAAVARRTESRPIAAPLAPSFRIRAFNIGPALDPGFAPGPTGEAAFAVSDTWLEDMRGRVNTLLRVLGRIALRANADGTPAPLEIRWLDRLNEAKLRGPDGSRIRIRDTLATHLRLMLALGGGGLDEQQLTREVNAKLDEIGTLRFQVPLPVLHHENDLIEARVWDLALETDLGAIQITGLRAMGKGLEIAIAFGPVSGTAMYSLQPASTPAAVALNVATAGGFSAMIANGGPVRVDAFDARAKLRLAPDASGDRWKVEVDEATLRASFGVMSTNLLNLPIVAAANLAGQLNQTLELDLVQILARALESAAFQLGWPGRFHADGAPPLESGKAALVEGRGLGLMVSLASFLFASPAMVPIAANDRVLYAFSEDFLRAWVEQLCGPLRIDNDLALADITGAGLTLPPAPPPPKDQPFNMADALNTLRVSLGPLGAYPLLVRSPRPLSKTEVRARLRIDSFDLVPVPQADVAFRLVAQSTLLIETVQIDYGPGGRFIPERCSRQPGGTLDPVDPIGSIDPIGPRGGLGGLPEPRGGLGGFGGLPEPRGGLGGLGGLPEPRGGLGIGTSIPFCQPPEIRVIWVRSVTVLQTHLAAVVRHELDVELGLRASLQRPLETLLLPAVGVRAPGNLRTSVVNVAQSDPVLGPAGTVKDAAVALTTSVVQRYLNPLHTEAPVAREFVISPPPLDRLIAIGQFQGATFAYRREGSTLLWDIDITEGLTPLIQQP
ncbi:hypothetical protein [Sorangium sp. So ce381]|uniref:hypothetical protein n=1 Tax=Sorangium sp. So ce381 TaxID=3133307 RepID=UPI003F5B458E